MTRRRVRPWLVAVAVLVFALDAVLVAPHGAPDAVVGSGYGDVATWRGFRRVLPWFSWPVRTRQVQVPLPTERVWIALATGVYAECELDAPCGCRFPPDRVETVESQVPGEGYPVSGRVATWDAFPRDAREFHLRVRSGGLLRDVLVQRGPASRPPTGPREGDEERLVHPIPWHGDLGGLDAEVVTSPADGVTSLYLTTPTVHGVTVEVGIRDGAGNQVEDWPYVFGTQSGAFGRQTLTHVPVPFGTRLCPHQPWWEVEVVGPEEKRTVVRLRPPPAR